MAGTSGDDSIVGTAGGDSLVGLGGADTLDGGGGLDSFVGGDGDDLLILSGPTEWSQVVDGGPGVDVLRIQNSEFGWGAPGHLGSTIYLNIESLASIEKLQFSSTSNQDLFAVITYDQLGTGLAADATLIGGQGADTLNVLAGVAGTYTVPTFSFQNWGPEDGIRLQGTDSRGYRLQATASHAGVDSLIGGSGDDTLIGGAGREHLDGLFASNSLDGGGGDDTLVSSRETDTLLGGDGDDLLLQYGVTSQYQVLDGGAGMDTLRASSDQPNGGVFGAPIHYEKLVSGLSSIERLEFASHSDQSLQVFLSHDQAQTLAPTLTVVGGQGADVLTVAVGDAPGDYALPAFQLENWQAQDTIELRGGAGASTLSGGAADAYLQGGAGDEHLSAAGAHNTLFGGAGNDVIVGGLGFNRTNGNTGDDTIQGRSHVGDWLLGGQGNDLIDASQSNAHNILNGNLGNDVIRGGAGGDSLRGGQGDDLVAGGSGADWITGDLGANTVTGGEGADTFFARGGGADVVTDFAKTQGDRIQIQAGLDFQTSQVGADVHIVISGGGSIVLLNQNLVTLGATSDWIVSG